MDFFESVNCNSLWDVILPFVYEGLLALVWLFAGLWIIRRISKMLAGYLETVVDKNVAPFLVTALNIGLKVLLGLSILSIVGIEITSFVAIIGGLGVGAGFALSGSLQNFASSIILFVFQPVKVGEIVEVEDTFGMVDEILVYYTVIKKFDNETVFIPNSEMVSSKVTNYSREEQRRVDLTIGISYDDDVRQAKKIIMEVLDQEEMVLKDPEYTIGLIELGDSSVNLAVWFFAKNPDWLKAKFVVTEKIKYALEESGLSIPYPQRDVHIFAEK